MLNTLIFLALSDRKYKLFVKSIPTVRVAQSWIQPSSCKLPGLSTCKSCAVWPGVGCGGAVVVTTLSPENRLISSWFKQTNKYSRQNKDTKNRYVLINKL